MLWERDPIADLHLLRNHCEEKLLKMQVFSSSPSFACPLAAPKAVSYPAKENPATAISACPNRL